MNALKRIVDIINSNINSALDRAEDPEKMIDLSIRETEEAIIKMKADLRDKISERNRAEEYLKNMEDKVSSWQKRASLAVQRNLEDLAREALIEKRSAEEKKEIAKENVAALNDLIKVTKENIEEASEKLKEMKATSSTLKARAKLAKDRMEVNKRFNSYSNQSYAKRLEELKAKIERWETEAQLSQNDIKREKETVSFEDLECESEIEKELEELKRNVNNAKEN